MDNEALGWNWENAVSVFVSGLFYLVCFLGTVSKKKKKSREDPASCIKSCAKLSFSSLSGNLLCSPLNYSRHCLLDIFFALVFQWVHMSMEWKKVQSPNTSEKLFFFKRVLPSLFSHMYTELSVGFGFCMFLVNRQMMRVLISSVTIQADAPHCPNSFPRPCCSPQVNNWVNFLEL